MDDLETTGRSADRDAGDAAKSDSTSGTCHQKACELPATITCDRCGQRFCAMHCSEFVLQRRDDSSKRPAHRDTLERLPTHGESYTLCTSCRAKPVPLKLPPLPELPSVSPSKTRGARVPEVGKEKPLRVGSSIGSMRSV